MYSEWGDYKIGVKIIPVTLFFSVCSLYPSLFSVKSPIQHLNNITNKDFLVPTIFTSLVFFATLYALVYLVISKTGKIISKHPIFTYILEFFYGFNICTSYVFVVIELIPYVSYNDALVIFLVLLLPTIIIILICYYKFTNFFINFMDANFNQRDKDWEGYSFDNKYFENSWKFVIASLIVLGIIGFITRIEKLVPIVFCYVLFLGGTYFMLASISCMIYSYKERKGRVSN